MHAIIRDSRVAYIAVCISLPLWLFFQCFTPFCFLRIWNIVLNGWNSYYLFSHHCLRYSMNVSAKVDIELISWCSVLMDCSFSLLPHLKLNERLWLNGYLAFDKISCICLCNIFMYVWLHCPMVMCNVSTIYIIFECWFISGLVKSVFERSLSGKKSQFLSKSCFCCYLRIYLLQPGYILSANKLAPLPRNESVHLP